MLQSSMYDPVLGLDMHLVAVLTPAGLIPTPVPMALEPIERCRDLDQRFEGAECATDVYGLLHRQSRLKFAGFGPIGATSMKKATDDRRPCFCPSGATGHS